MQPSQGQAIDYLYDALGRRVARRVGGTVTQRLLYLDDLRPAAELDASGTRLAAVYLYGSRRNVPDYVITYGADGTQSGTFRIITDHLGSPRVVVNTATEAIMAGEAVVASVRYDEWGNEQDYSARAGWRHLPFGYAGGLVDRDPMTGALVTKLVHFGAREYDPETRQWLTRDPSGFGGGLNLYGYVVGDPINRVDADGNHPALVAVVVAAGVGALQELASQWIHGHGSLDCIDRRAVFEAAVIGAAFEVGAGAIALGVGVWSGRTLFRASRATGRFRPSFTYEAGPGVNVYADTAADGIIDFGIYNNRSVPGVTGTDLLRRMMNYYGPRARAVRGNWYSGTNLEQFNAFRSLNYTEAEAAASTFTGRGLEAYGFRVDPSALRVTYGSEGATEVIATFVR